MKRALIFASALLPASAMGAPSGIAWTNGKRLDAAALQQFDNLKANQSAADALQASKLNRSGDTSTNQTLNGSTMNMGALHGTVVDDGTYTAAASGQKRSLASRLNDAVYLTDFGAKCDGSTDDTVAMQRWVAYAQGKAGVVLVAPGGICVFRQPVSIQSGSNLEFKGAGRYATTFLYTGTTTSVSLLTFGNMMSSAENWNIHDFSVNSSQAMAAGNAMLMDQFSDSTVHNVTLGGIDASAINLYNGIQFNGVHVITFTNYGIKTRHDGITISAQPGTVPSTNIWIENGYSDFNGRYGLHIGGGIGGVFVDTSEFMGNAQANAAVDDEDSGLGNREIIFGPNSIFDGLGARSQYGIYVNSPASQGGSIVLNGFYGSSILDGLNITSWPNGIISVGASRIQFCGRDGIRYSDASVTMSIGANTIIDVNKGYGVNSTVNANKIYSSAVVAASNVLGQYGGNTGVGAWQSYAPTVSSSQGSVSSYTVRSANYIKSGRTVSFSASIGITKNGTGSGSLQVTLPTTSSIDSTFGGRAAVVSGKGIVGQVNANSSVVSISTYDNAYPASDGEVILISGTYEDASP